MATTQAQIKTDKTVELSPEELVALDEGIRSEQNEPIYGLDEALEIARQRRKEWKKIPARA